MPETLSRVKKTTIFKQLVEINEPSDKRRLRGKLAEIRIVIVSRRSSHTRIAISGVRSHTRCIYIGIYRHIFDSIADANVPSPTPTLEPSALCTHTVIMHDAFNSVSVASYYAPQRSRFAKREGENLSVRFASDSIEL